ncbi:hypothetical protein C8R43DRAFT_1228986 [Mycena crocata]|nr:hypothetical protein C8R43DRAFT_1228986 [Mycena crocata]
MEFVRAFCTSARRAKQPLFELPKTLKRPSRKDDQLYRIRRHAVYNTSPRFNADNKAIARALRCDFTDLKAQRSACRTRIETALGKLQDPKSFRVQDMTFDLLMRSPTISYPPEFALIDLFNPLGVPPDTPKSALPPIHNPSLVAKALTEAGFTGSFYSVGSRSAVEWPWPNYRHVHRGGYIYPPRLSINNEMGGITLTLPGATVQPLYDFFKRCFASPHSCFRQVMESITIWARSWGIGMNPQTIGLMIVASMQCDVPLFNKWGDKRGWSAAEYREFNGGPWIQTRVPVDVDFEKPVFLHLELVHQILGFFQHWTDMLSLTEGAAPACSIRQGRESQLIPNQYNPNNPVDADYTFRKSNFDDPTKDFIPWRFDRLVIQDPFLVTHNHAENLSDLDYFTLVQQLPRAVSLVRAGRHVDIYGKEAIEPDSYIETRILNNPVAYAPALNLLRNRGNADAMRGDPLETSNGFGLTSSQSSPSVWQRPPTSKTAPPSSHSPLTSADPRPSTATSTPHDLSTTGRVSPLQRNQHDRNEPWRPRTRRFHTCSRSLAAKGSGNTGMGTPPRPIVPQRGSPDNAREGWGLRTSVRLPTFWHPGPETLKLPTKGESIGPVPPIRATKAGVAYKNAASRPKEFHTSAYCANKFEAPIQRRVDRKVLESRKKTLASVQEAIQARYGAQYTVQLFGSARYGISSPSSDLDMVIMDPARAHGFSPDRREKPIPHIYRIKPLAEVLRRAGFKIIEAVEGASVPIVKFQDPQTGHSCDINVNDRLGAINSDLIKRYCQLNPLLIDIILYIKRWAKPLGLNSPGARGNHPITFSSYGLVMMTIGFLQYRGLLPNLQEGLPPLNKRSIKGTFWLRLPKKICCDVRYNEAKDWTPPEVVPTHQALQDWFKFWGSEFDFKTEIMSIRHGGRIQESSLVLERPFRGVLRNIDPFIHTKNISQNISRDSLNEFRFLCRQESILPDFDQKISRLFGNTSSEPYDHSESFHDLEASCEVHSEEELGLRIAELPNEESPLPWRTAPKKRNAVPVDSGTAQDAPPSWEDAVKWLRTPKDAGDQSANRLGTDSENPKTHESVLAEKALPSVWSEPWSEAAGPISFVHGSPIFESHTPFDFHSGREELSSTLDSVRPLPPKAEAVTEPNSLDGNLGSVPLNASGKTPSPSPPPEPEADQEEDTDQVGWGLR